MREVIVVCGSRKTARGYYRAIDILVADGGNYSSISGPAAIIATSLDANNIASSSFSPPNSISLNRTTIFRPGI